jgi:hypothetical protein
MCNSFDLHCLLREKAIDFIHGTYPQCLPKAREKGKPMFDWRVSEEYAPRDGDAAKAKASPLAAEKHDPGGTARAANA